MIDLLTSDLYELEACLDKLSMPLKEDTLAPPVVSDSVCYSPNDRLKKLDPA